MGKGRHMAAVAKVQASEAREMERAVVVGRVVADSEAVAAEAHLGAVDLEVEVAVAVLAMGSAVAAGVAGVAAAMEAAVVVAGVAAAMEAAVAMALVSTQPQHHRRARNHSRASRSQSQRSP